MGFSKRSTKREVQSNIGVTQEINKTSNKTPNFTTKAASKIEPKNYKMSRGKGIIKIRT